MVDRLTDLYQNRKGGYVKSPQTENFLQHLNRSLQAAEQELYTDDLGIEHPFIFVFGLPRSGTTLMTQLIAHSLDVGFINNFEARFWLAPLHGIRLFKSIYGDQRQTDFHSDYARTSELSDIHEFGYFWRYWLQKETFEGVTRCKEMEPNINWAGLKKTLANMQQEFGKPMIFKNIFGSYHLKTMQDILSKVLYVYIERDPLDAAVSILQARKKYYTDLNTWWSYMPIEYEQLRDKDYYTQIAGQVYYLKRFYDREIKNNDLNVVRVSYQSLTGSPHQVFKQIQDTSLQLLDYSLTVDNPPPGEFPYRSYPQSEDKEKFSTLIRSLENSEGAL
ncbi:MAG: hypothetical protein GF313_08405 [Caldithrix sp.]|nr:hypothetical protein [Caldithrix sp.]